MQISDPRVNRRSAWIRCAPLFMFTFTLALTLALCGCDDGESTRATDTSDTVGSMGGEALTPDQKPDDPCVEGIGIDIDGDQICDGVWPDWSATARLEPGTHRGDVFQLGAKLPAFVREGLYHAQHWPVAISGVFIPYRMLTRTLNPDEPDPALQRLRAVAGQLYGFNTLDGFYDWLGLVPYNAPDAEGPYASPIPSENPPQTPMGASVVETEHGPGLTFTCTACHAGRLLGRTVIGLANKRSRANDFFAVAHQVLPALRLEQIREVLDLNEDELALLDQSIDASSSVGFKSPAVLGLDTSVAHVSLSLARRGDDPHASPSLERQENPASTALGEVVADSKPLPWWTVKYKTRWFADGSVTAGNPLVINILWNEIGRGTDLRALDGWIDENRRALDALTAAVFASSPPRWTDYFSPESIDLERARAGQALFAARCASCHGTYEKAWDSDEQSELSALERLETTRVIYHAQTPTFDVGTDTGRAQGQAALHQQITRLHIYTKHGIESVLPNGYVPPPLDGVWSRYPYLHNNSVPSLCALLSPVSERPVTFRQGPSESESDFDAECVGYPVGDAIPDAWSEIEDSLFDVRRSGLSNIGHDESVWGGPLTGEERGALIMFLKTL